MSCPVHPIPDYDTRYLEVPEYVVSPEQAALNEAAEQERHESGTCDGACDLCYEQFERSLFATEAEYLADQAAQEARYAEEEAEFLASCTCKNASVVR